MDMAEDRARNEHSMHNVCGLCGTTEKLRACARCRIKYYCSRDHQTIDWKEHKKCCVHPGGINHSETNGMKSVESTNLESRSQTITNGPHGKFETTKTVHSSFSNKSIRSDSKLHNERSSESDISSDTKALNPTSVDETSNVGPRPNVTTIKTHDISSNKNPNKKTTKGSMLPINESLSRTFSNIELVQYVIDCLQKYGICVLDKFVGDKRGSDILAEVQYLHESGVFCPGQVVKKAAISERNVRGDSIVWVDGKESNCANIGYLISRIDALIMQCNGKLGTYNISGRTKAMVACYPGRGTGYVRHVDNPNGDGRCVTVIYYLNKDWNFDCGGTLKIYPEGREDVAEIDPIFDRLLCFWSDRRNPHEVQPSQTMRFAITVWYFDADERARALQVYDKMADNQGTYQHDIQLSQPDENSIGVEEQAKKTKKKKKKKHKKKQS